MGHDQIRLSVIVPFYGVEKYIGQCLSSLFEQDIPEIEYEVICVNDCSPDDSERIVRDFRQKHGNLILLRHEKNKKLGAARNTGLAAASGKFVWFVDSDDYIKPNCFRHLLSECEANCLDILHWSVQDNQGNWIRRIEDSGVCTGIEELISGSQDVTFPWNRIYNREFLLNNNLWFNDVWGGDVVHTILALNAARRLMNRQECYYFYRTDNMTSDMRSPITAHKVISFSFVLAQAIDGCKDKVSTALLPFIDEVVEWRVNRSFKPVLKMPIKEKRKFYRSLREDGGLKDFVMGIANGKVRFVIRYPLAVYMFYPLYIFLMKIRSLINTHK